MNMFSYSAHLDLRIISQSVECSQKYRSTIFSQIPYHEYIFAHATTEIKYIIIFRYAQVFPLHFVNMKKNVTRRSLLAVSGSTLAAGVTTSHTPYDLIAESSVHSSESLQLTNISVSNKNDINATVSHLSDDGRVFQLAAALNNGDILQTVVTVVNDSTDPVSLALRADTPEPINIKVRRNDDNQSKNKVNLIIEASLTDTTAPGNYVMEFKIDPLSENQGNTPVQLKTLQADIHFLIDASRSMSNDIQSVRGQIGGFFNKIDGQVSKSVNIDAKISVSFFGSVGGEQGGDPGPDVTIGDPKLSTDIGQIEDSLQNVRLGTFDEDAFVATERVLSGGAGERPDADQVLIMFADELNPRVNDNFNPIARKVQQEASTFIGIGDNSVPALRNFTETAEGEFRTFSELNTNQNFLPSKVADLVRESVVANESDPVVQTGSGIFTTRIQAELE